MTCATVPNRDGIYDRAMTTTTAPRRGRPGYDRSTLVAVCVATFNRHGYDATSMGMLAAELGVSKSAIYHHVSSKEEILEMALDQALDALEAVLAEAEQLDESGADRLEKALRSTVQVLIEQMPQVTLLLRLRGNSPVETAALQRRRDITSRFGAIVESGQKDGSLVTSQPPRRIARLVLGMVNSIVDWYRPGESAAEPAQLEESILRLALEGVLAER